MTECLLSKQGECAKVLVCYRFLCSLRSRILFSVFARKPKATDAIHTGKACYAPLAHQGLPRPAARFAARSPRKDTESLT